MAERKPQEDLVKIAGRAMTHPEQLTGSEIKRMAARILDDQRNDPEPGKSKPSLAAKVIAKVGDLLPDAIKPDPSAKTKPAAKAKATATAAPAAKSAAAKPAARPAAAAKPVVAAKPAVAAKPPAAAKPKTAAQSKKA